MFAKIILFAGVFVLGLSADVSDALLSGGRSPDGRHEVRLARLDRDEADSEYMYYVRNARTGDIAFQVEGSNMYGFDQILGGDGSAHWSQDSRYLAIRDRSTKHGSSLTLLQVSPVGDAVEIALPDYRAQALSMAGAKSTRVTDYSNVRKWDRDRLHVEFVFDTYNQTGPNVFRFNVVLRVIDGVATIDSIGKVKEGIGGLG